MACVGQWVRALEEVFPEGVPLSAFELFLECAVRPCDSPAMGTHFLQALYTVRFPPSDAGKKRRMTLSAERPSAGEVSPWWHLELGVV
jgi:hypothetical protein